MSELEQMIEEDKETMQELQEQEIVQEDYKEQLAAVKEVARRIKKSLKTHSKSQLIDIIIHQASMVQELQGISRQLLEENKSLKGD